MEEPLACQAIKRFGCVQERSMIDRLTHESSITPAWWPSNKEFDCKHTSRTSSHESYICRVLIPGESINAVICAYNEAAQFVIAGESEVSPQGTVPPHYNTGNNATSTQTPICHVRAASAASLVTDPTCVREHATICGMTPTTDICDLHT